MYDGRTVISAENPIADSSTPNGTSPSARLIALPSSRTIAGSGASSRPIRISTPMDEARRSTVMMPAGSSTSDASSSTPATRVENTSCEPPLKNRNDGLKYRQYSPNRSSRPTRFSLPSS